MARGAVAARQRARKDEARAERRAARAITLDVVTQAAMDADFIRAGQDWALVRCEACGTEQGSGGPLPESHQHRPCSICGHDTAVYADTLAS